MAERMEADLWRLDIPLVGNPLKNLNSYLITGERNLLIDMGFRQVPCREAMDRQLRQIGVDMDRTDIFLTHLHSDHAGLAPELVRPGCRIYISGVDLPGLEDAMSPVGGRDCTGTMSITAFRRRRRLPSGTETRPRTPGHPGGTPPCIPRWRTERN